jgi:peroxiredoxin family protein
MKQLFFTVVFAWIFLIVSFAQSKPGDTATINQKFYFPVSLYSDPAALAKEIPHLAEQVLIVYTEKNKTTYRKNAFSYNIVAGNYKTAIEMIDSIQNKLDDRSWGMQSKMYALAKEKDKTEGNLFKETFQKNFYSEFNQLTFSQKVNVAGLDSLAIDKWITKSYKDKIEKLKKKASDSLNMQDAKSLCDNYSDYLIYNKVHPLVSPYISDPKFQNMYPAVKSSKVMGFGGVVPVEGIDEAPDPNMKYKLLMELTTFTIKQGDTAAIKEMNLGLVEAGRILNLHVAAGIPKENIELVLVVHAGALNAFLTNEKYRKKFDIDNPNMPLLKELESFKTKIINCGQAMHFFGFEREDFIPGIKVALTAQTVLSAYQSKNYVLYDLHIEE